MQHEKIFLVGYLQSLFDLKTYFQLSLMLNCTLCMLSEMHISLLQLDCHVVKQICHLAAGWSQVCLDLQAVRGSIHIIGPLASRSMSCCFTVAWCRLKLNYQHWTTTSWIPVISYTVYPKKYAHGFCFAVLCCGYTLTDFPISMRLTSLALWQSNDCPSASKATLMNMDKYFMWIHYERLHNHNKAKHNKTVGIFLGIYCNKLQRDWSMMHLGPDSI